MEIGKNIKLIRTNQNISQKKLAQMVGITNNYLSMIENDSKKPSLSLIEKLAAVLQIPVKLLFSEVQFK